MPISPFASTPPAGVPDAASGSESDAASVHQAGSARTIALTQPLQMSLLDRIIDFFRGGVRQGEHAERIAAAVEKHVATICHDDSTLGADCHLQRMQSFLQLRDMAKDSATDKFHFDVLQTTLPDESGNPIARMTYRIAIDDTTLIHGEIDESDRDSFLSFHRAMATTQILPPDVQENDAFHPVALQNMPHISIQHGDALILTRLADALPDALVFHERSGMQDLAKRIDDVNHDPVFAETPHAALAEKARVLSDAFPDQQFDITFGDRRDRYTLTVNQGMGEPDVFLRQCVIAPHEAQQFPLVLAGAIKLDIHNKLALFNEQINDRAGFITGSSQTMCDDLPARALLMARRNDPALSSATLTGIDATPGEPTFTAKFGDQSLVFSNRLSTMGELRGERLINMLTTPFDNLEALMVRDHMTARDPIVTYAVNPTKSTYLSVLDDVMNDRERATVHRQVGDIAVANTTLREIWQLPEEGGVSGDAGVGAGSPSALGDRHNDPALSVPPAPDAPAWMSQYV